MDKIDDKLIKLLASNSRYTLKELSEKVFLSPPAVAARIKKLESEGIILSYGVQLDLHKLGYEIVAFIFMRIPPEKKERFIQNVPSFPQVIECNCITGNYSALVKAALRSTSELDDFVVRLQKFGATQTEVVFCTPVTPRNPDLGALSE